MPESKMDLTALIGSRICHDLISPLGAIGNGVELLSMSGGAPSPEMMLISESVENANARIRFFRVAFGTSGNDQSIARTEIQSILDDITRNGRLTIDWVPSDNPLRGEVKLAFLLIQCLETAMPYGGNIRVTLDGSRWTVLGRAEKLKFDADLWEVLSNPAATAPISPAQVQFALVPHQLVQLNRKLTLEQVDSEITLRF